MIAPVFAAKPDALTPQVEDALRSAMMQLAKRESPRPQLPPAKTPVRRLANLTAAEIEEVAKLGLTGDQLAARLGFSKGYIFTIASRAGIKIGRARGKGEELSDATELG